MVVTHQVQTFFDGRIALAEGVILPVILFPVLDVQRHDPGVVLLDKGDGVLVRGSEVADIKIDPGVGRSALQRAFETFRR